MLNQKLHLNTKSEQRSIREGFGEGLVQAAIKNDNIVGLCADLTNSTKMNLFAEKFPERFIEVGVAEQNLVSIAAGMAAMEKIPFVGSFAVFSPGRNWEQIRTNVCYNNVPVKIVGSHAGLSASADGGSHQGLEDIALTRVLPNMTVISPCDALEAKKATIAMSKLDSPSYIRLCRNKTKVITTKDTPFKIGKSQIVFVPEVGLAQVGIIATGPLLHKAIQAAKELEKKDIKVKVMNLSTIKPLDADGVITLAKEAKVIVTVEEHQLNGGMGSAIAECLAKHYPVPIEFIGLDDAFGQSGTYDELIKHYNLDTPNIVKAVEKVLKRKDKKYI